MPLTEGYTKLKSKAEQIVESVKSSKFLSQKKEMSLPYAYPCDNYMDAILSNGLVRKTLQLFADKYCKEQIKKIKSTGQLVSRSNYPHLYDVLQSCYKSLNVEDIPEVYITNQLKGINALSVGTDNAPIILISCKAVISLPDGELKYTIKGLLDNLNNKSEILGPIVSDLIDVPLNQWYRCAEYTADRAGLICVKSILHIKSLFTRLCNTNIKETNQIARYFELSNIHPMYNNRLNQLEQFISLQQ